MRVKAAMREAFAATVEVRQLSPGAYVDFIDHFENLHATAARSAAHGSGYRH